LKAQRNPGGTAEFAEASFVPEWMKDFLFNRKGGSYEHSDQLYFLETGASSSAPTLKVLAKMLKTSPQVRPGIKSLLKMKISMMR